MTGKAGEEGLITAKAGESINLLVQLLKLASLIHRPMRDVVAEASGATPDEIKIIMCLGGEGAMAGHDITDLMAIPPMNVSRALASLQKRGWVENALDSNDKRRKPVQLSDQGRSAFQALAPALSNVATHLLGTLNTGEKKSLEKSVSKIMGRLEAWPAEGPQNR